MAAHFGESENHINYLEHSIIQVLEAVEGGGLPQQFSERPLYNIICEENTHIDSKVWQAVFRLTQECIIENKPLLLRLAQNPNQSIPREVLKQLANLSLDVNLGKNAWLNLDTDIFKAICHSKNANIDNKIFDTICTNVANYIKHTVIFADSLHQESLTDDLQLNSKKSIELYKPKIGSISEILLALFSTSNQFSRWKDKHGRNSFLRFLSDDSLESLEAIIGEEKLEELLIQLIRNESIHTPDLVSRLFTFFKKQNYQFTNKEIIKELPRSGSNCIKLSGKTDSEVLHQKQTEFVKTFTPDQYQYDVEKLFSVLNLRSTFVNLQKIFEYTTNKTDSLLEVRNKINPENQDQLSFNSLVDSSKNSIPSLFIEIQIAYHSKNRAASLWFNTWNPSFKKTFDELLRTFRVYLVDVENSNGQKAFAMEANILGYTPPKYKTMNYNISGDTGRSTVLTNQPGFNDNKIWISDKIIAGAYPKTLISKLIQIQQTLLELKTILLKAEQKALTPEDYEFSQLIDQFYFQLKQESNVIADLTQQEIYKIAGFDPQNATTEQVLDALRALNSEAFKKKAIISTFNFLLNYFGKDDNINIYTKIETQNFGNLKIKFRNEIRRSFLGFPSFEIIAQGVKHPDYEMIVGKSILNIHNLQKRYTNFESGSKSDIKTSDEGFSHLFILQLEFLLLELHRNCFHLNKYTNYDLSTKIKYIGKVINAVKQAKSQLEIPKGGELVHIPKPD
jgi:hypothetical protein